MTTIQQKALAELILNGPMRGSSLGWALWGETTESVQRGEGSHGNNKFCRAAGRVLKALEKKGLVATVSMSTCTLWRPTAQAWPVMAAFLDTLQSNFPKTIRVTRSL